VSESKSLATPIIAQDKADRTRRATLLREKWLRQDARTARLNMPWPGEEIPQPQQPAPAVRAAQPKDVQRLQADINYLEGKLNTLLDREKKKSGGLKRIDV
jgi:hypothetical protein